MKNKQQVDLIKEVFSIIGENAAKEKSNHITIDVYMHDEGIKLDMQYYDIAGGELVYATRSACLDKKIWFDSSSNVGQPHHEWELDWSLHKIKE